MKLKEEQLLTRWMVLERCWEYQMVKLTNLNDNCDSLITIFEMHIIFASINIDLVDISDTLCNVTIKIRADGKENCIVLEYMMLIDEIFEFLIYMNCDTVFMNNQTLYVATPFKYLNILHIPTSVIIFNENSIGFLASIATTTTISWKILKIQMIPLGGFYFAMTNIDAIYLIGVI